jgi:hypothetical protein
MADGLETGSPVYRYCTRLSISPLSQKLSAYHGLAGTEIVANDILSLKTMKE